jgi:hypothetical protein
MMASMRQVLALMRASQSSAMKELNDGELKKLEIEVGSLLELVRLEQRERKQKAIGQDGA